MWRDQKIWCTLQNSVVGVQYYERRGAFKATWAWIRPKMHRWASTSVKLTPASAFRQLPSQSGTARSKKMPGCIVLFWYRFGSGIVSLSQSSTGLTGCRTVRHSGSQHYSSQHCGSQHCVGHHCRSKHCFSQHRACQHCGTGSQHCSSQHCGAASCHAAPVLQSPVVMRLQSGMSCGSSPACHAASVRHSGSQHCRSQHCGNQHCGTGSHHRGSQHCGAASCHTAPHIAPAVSLTPLVRCNFERSLHTWIRWGGTSGVIDTAEAAPATPPRWQQRCHWHRWGAPAVSMTPLVHRLFRITLRIRSHLQKCFNPLMKMKKTRGQKSRDTVHLIEEHFSRDNVPLNIQREFL
jgi:hypothetical protein